MWSMQLAHLAVLVVIMTACQKELKGLLVPEDGRPSQRCVPLVQRIRVAHICPLDEAFHLEKIVLCAPQAVTLGRGCRDGRTYPLRLGGAWR